MKKILTALTISFSTLLVSTIAPAGPHDQEFRGHGASERGKGFEKRANRFDDDQEFQERRKMREERGVKRLKQHKWQTGYVMPQHYRGNSYKTDYKDHNLPKPSRNQQWYKINNDFILVDSDNNSILKIQQD